MMAAERLFGREVVGSPEYFLIMCQCDGAYFGLRVESESEIERAEKMAAAQRKAKLQVMKPASRSNKAYETPRPKKKSDGQASQPSGG